MSGRPSFSGNRRQSSIKHIKNEELSASYDYVLVFPMEGPAGQMKQTSIAKFAVQEITKAGLETFSYLSVQSDELIVLVRCPFEKMKKFADEIDFKMELDPDVVKENLEKGLPDPTKPVGSFKIRPIFINDDPKYSPIRPYDSLFGRYETSVGDSLYKIPDGEGTPFSKLIRLKLIYYMLRAPHHQGGCGLEISKMVFKKQMHSIFPLHDRLISDQILNSACKIGSAPWHAPVEDIRQYFGEKVALYSVFIGHYSYWLLAPSLIGLVFQLVVWGTNNYSHPVLPFYSLVICLWSILMLEYWKRREATTAMEWGMTEYEQHEPDRPEFKGHPIRSYIDGKDMLYYPPEEYLDNVANSGSCVGAYMLLVLGVVTSIYILRFSIEAQVGTYASTIASVLNTVQITVFNYIYRSIVIKLTDFENPRTDTMYEDSLIMKLFVFQFVNSYASFFFLAFIAQYLAKSKNMDDDVVGQCGATSCMIPLSINLAIIFGVRLTITNFLDIFIPYINYKQKIKKETAGVQDITRLTPAEHDYMLMDYDGMMNGIETYADTAIQYGFSVLFVTALPCAAFFSLVSNFIKTKLNLWKLTTFFQRPVPHGAQDIGTWQSIFQFLSVAGVITNGALVCFTMDVLRDYSSLGRTWLFIGFQWTMVMVQFIVAEVVPDVPDEVEIQIQRMEFIRSKVLDKVEDDDLDEAELERMNSTASAAAREEQSNTYICCGTSCAVLPCCRTHKGKYLEKKMNLTNCSEVVVKQYPVLSTTLHKNPMQQQIRSGI